MSGTPPRRRHEAAGEDEVEQRRSASARFEIRPTLGIDRRVRWPGSRSLIYTSTVAHEDGFALPRLRGSGAGGGRRPHHLLSPAGRDSRIVGHAARLDPAPELLVIDVFPQHAVQA